MPSFKSAINLNGNELQNAVIQVLSGNPSSPKAGQIWFLSTTGVPYYYNGQTVRPLDSSQLVDHSIPIAALAVNPLDRGQHINTQAANTISDLSTVVKAYTLDSFAAPVNDLILGSHKITLLAPGTNPTDAVNLSQVNTLIAQAVAGQTAIKNPARVVATANITLSGLQTIDGVTVSVGDRVLVTAQTNASQNGLYIVQTGAWTLAVDADSASEWTQGTELLVNEGVSFSGSVWRQTVANPTLTTLAYLQVAKMYQYAADGTTLSLTGNLFAVRLGSGLTTTAGGIALDTAIATRKYSVTLTGDGTTTSFTVTHNLNTQDVVVNTRDASQAMFVVDWAATTVNAITLTFGSAPASGVTTRVTVLG